MIRKLVALFLIAAFCTFFIAAPILASDRERASVLDFSSSGDIDKEYQIAASNKLTKVLFAFKRFDMIERSEIDRILAEQKFQNTGLVDQQKAVEIGKILNIDYAFIGRIDYLSTTYNKPNYVATAKTTVKIIDVRSGKLLHIIETDGTDTNSIQQTALLNALEGCFSDKLLFQLRNTFAPFSSIFKVDGNFIYIANGADIGIKAGLRYRILRPEKTTDPNEDIADAFKTEIGFAEVVQVTETKSQAKILSKKVPIAQGDLVQELAADDQMTFDEPDTQTVQPDDKAQSTNDTTTTTVSQPDNTTSDKTEPDQPEPVKPEISGAWVNDIIMRTGGLNFYDYYGEVTGTDSILTFEDRIGYEWKSSGIGVGIVLGYGGSQFVSIANAGLELSEDIPLIPDFCDLSLSGAAGMAMGGGYDENYNYLSADSFYLTGAVGAKMYLGGFKGLRLQCDLFFQLGPYILNCDGSGIGMRYTLGFCI